MPPLTITLSALAHLVQGELIHSGQTDQFSGLESLESAEISEISFFGNEKYRAQFQHTQAGAILIPKAFAAILKLEAPQNSSLIAVENPSLAFSQVIDYFLASAKSWQPGIHPQATVHPSALCDPSKVKVHAGAVIMEHAIIGEGSEIFPNVVINEYVKIGQDCKIMANVSIREHCILGDRVILQPGCVIGSDGYGYEFHDGKHVKIPQVGHVVIEDDVEIGSNSTIDRARFGKTKIGKGTKIDNLVQIGHNVVIGQHCLVISQAGIAGSAQLKDHVIVAAQAGIGGHVTVGERAILSARTAVTASVEGNATYAGKPAQPIRDEMKQQACLRKLPEWSKYFKKNKS